MSRDINLQLHTEQLRSLVLEALAAEPTGQIASLGRAVAEAAVKRGIVPNPFPGNVGYSPAAFSLSRPDYSLVQDVFWDLLIEGVVRPGLGDGVNDQWPWYHVTEHGEKAVRGTPPSPHDPDGYSQRLLNDIPNLDSVIKEYLVESLHTFRINALMASTVTLGVASEKAFLLLIEAYASAIPDAQRQKRFLDDTQGRTIKRQWDEFNKVLQGRLLKILPGDHTDGVEVILNGVFLLIRNYRNDAGHPTGRGVDRDQAYANLQMFPSYLRRVYALIDWLGKNPV